MGIREDYKIFLASHLETRRATPSSSTAFYREVGRHARRHIRNLLDEPTAVVGDGFLRPVGLLAYLTDSLRRNPYDQHLLMRTR